MSLYKRIHEDNNISIDIGSDNNMVMTNLEKCTHANYLYIESTYGDRNHKDTQTSINEFKRVIIDTLHNMNLWFWFRRWFWCWLRC